MRVLILFLLSAVSPGQPSYEKANELFVAQKFPEALVAVDEALRLDARLVPALTLKAKLAMAANRLDVARLCLEQALAIDPKAPYAQFLYGMVAYMNNEMREASTRFQKARELAPRDARVALYLGLTIESVGKPADALALYEEAIRLERLSGQQQADTLLPGARLLFLLGRLEESERWIRQALQLSPKLRDAHFELARILLKKGEAAQAAAEGETALSLAGGSVADSAIHYLLIRAWQQAGKPDRAAFHAGAIKAREN
ncbi:MAG: tetratricopeptide repeat protein [Acidobacteria bacterium]|nr:tetratricopeptide repeat protein [Acidobacteriota bacterium]